MYVLLHFSLVLSLELPTLFILKIYQYRQLQPKSFETDFLIMVIPSMTTLTFLLTAIVVTVWENNAYAVYITTRTATRQTVSLRDVQTVLRTATKHNAPDLLYYLSRMTLHQPDGKSVDLARVTSESKRVLSRQAKLFVDNRQVNLTSSKLILRTGAGYTVVLSEDGFTHGIWSSTLALTPVHSSRYPGLFVNVKKTSVQKSTHQSSNSSRSFDDDEVYPGRRGDPYRPDSVEPVPVPAIQSCSKPSTCRQVRIAGASDRFLCHRFNRSYVRALEHVEATLLAANQPFEAQTCLRLKLTHLELSCALEQSKDLFGGFTRDDAIGLIYNLKDMWNANPRLSTIRRDAAIFFPSYFDDTVASGVAFVGPICVRDWAYAWVEGFEPIVVAHEIGHLFNCVHETELMSTYWDASTPFRFSADSLSLLYARADLHVASFADCLPMCKTMVSPTPSTLPSRSSSPTPSMLPSRSSLPTPSPSASPSIKPSQSSAPSQQMVPSRSMEPMQSLQSTGLSTCASGFDKSRAYACGRLYFGRRRWLRTRLVLIGLQKYGKLVLVFVVRGKNVAMKSLSVGVSMDATTNVSLITKFLPVKGVVHTKVPVNIQNLKMATGSETCCNSVLHVTYLAKLCNMNGKCDSRQFTLKAELHCDACTLSVFEAASRSRKCYLCTSG